MNHASNDEKDHYRDILNRPFMQKEDILDIRALFKTSGTFKAAQDSANEGFNEAIETVLKLEKNEAVQLLHDLTQNIRNRIA